MARNDSSPRVTCTPEQVDEAAVWMTLLHSSNRNGRTDDGFRRWLAADPAHPVAFEKVSIAHEVTGSAPREPFLHLRRWERAGMRAGALRATGAIAAVLLLALLGLFFYWRSAGVATAVGEQRLLTLADGTQVMLNTSTRIVVDFGKQRRHVELKNGEALFDVAKSKPSRPFVVSAGGREITALGTSFVVRHDEQRVSITLMDGKVSVASVTRDPTTDRDARTLSPGERVTFARSAVPKIDRPPLERVTAWRSGHVEFDKVPLADAIVEMNRYSATKLALEHAEAGGIPITGIFRTGASVSFAAAVAAAYRLEVVESAGAIMLAGLPGPASAPAARENIPPLR
jgi:transmembrane sensor